MGKSLGSGWDCCEPAHRRPCKASLLRSPTSACPSAHINPSSYLDPSLHSPPHPSPTSCPLLLLSPWTDSAPQPSPPDASPARTAFLPGLPALPSGPSSSFSALQPISFSVLVFLVLVMKWLDPIENHITSQWLSFPDLATVQVLPRLPDTFFTWRDNCAQILSERKTDSDADTGGIRRMLDSLPPALGPGSGLSVA